MRLTQYFTETVRDGTVRVGTIPFENRKIKYRPVNALMPFLLRNPFNNQLTWDKIVDHFVPTLTWPSPSRYLIDPNEILEFKEKIDSKKDRFFVFINKYINQ